MSNTSEKGKMLLIVCSDGKSIDAKRFHSESNAVQFGYMFEIVSLKVESNSDIIEKVGLFCEKRAEIKNNHANDESLVQQKLDEFNSEFRRLYQMDANNLIIAAFDLEIKSLVDVMLDDVDGMFTSMTSDEAYNTFFVNLNKLENDGYTFKVMKQRLHASGRWAFEGL